MARPGSVPRVIAAGIVAAASSLAGGAPPVARADDEPVETILVPGRTMSALAVDLDRDGEREVARLSDEIGPGLTLELWAFRDGEWAPGPFATVPDPTEGDPSIAHYVVGAAILEVRGPDGPGLLVVANGTDLNSQLGPHTCCLEVHEAVLRGTTLALDPVAVPSIAADEVAVADLDGDAVDELVVSSAQMEPADEEPTVTLTALRRGPDGYAAAGSTQVAAWSASATQATIGETDGLPGDELLFVTDDGQEIVRVADRGNGLGVERAGDGLAQHPWLVGTLGGRLLAMGERPVALTWPADATPTVEELDGLQAWSFPLGIVGEGDEAILYSSRTAGTFPAAMALDVFDADLRPIGSVDVGSPSVEALWRILQAASESGGWTLQRTLDPYSGPISLGHGRGPAAVVTGAVIEAGGPDGYRVSTMAPMLGMPVGAVGPDDAWYAICDGCTRDGRRAWLSTGVVYATGQLTLARWDPFAEIPGPAVTVRHDGALALGEDPEAGMTELLAAPGGFELVVEPAPGTAVVSWDGRRLVDHGFLTEAVRLPVDPPNLDREDLEEGDDEEIEQALRFERTLIVIGPDGRFSVRAWSGTFAAEAPMLTARPHLSSGLTADVRGQVAPYASVTVDGKPAEVSELGSFAETVGAPPWPRTVVIEATDPFGGVSQTTVEVIGIVDYRGLPWPLVIATLVAAFGIVLFVRVPRLKRAPAVATADGELEELDDLGLASLDRGRR